MEQPQGGPQQDNGVGPAAEPLRDPSAVVADIPRALVVLEEGLVQAAELVHDVGELPHAQGVNAGPVRRQPRKHLHPIFLALHALLEQLRRPLPPASDELERERRQYQQDQGGQQILELNRRVVLRRLVCRFPKQHNQHQQQAEQALDHYVHLPVPIRDHHVHVHQPRVEHLVARLLPLLHMLHQQDLVQELLAVEHAHTTGAPAVPRLRDIAPTQQQVRGALDADQRDDGAVVTALAGVCGPVQHEREDDGRHDRVVNGLITQACQRVPELGLARLNPLLPIVQEEPHVVVGRARRLCPFGALRWLLLLLHGNLGQVLLRNAAREGVVLQDEDPHGHSVGRVFRRHCRAAQNCVTLDDLRDLDAEPTCRAPALVRRLQLENDGTKRDAIFKGDAVVERHIVAVLLRHERRPCRLVVPGPDLHHDPPSRVALALQSDLRRSLRLQAGKVPPCETDDGALGAWRRRLCRSTGLHAHSRLLPHLLPEARAHLAWCLLRPGRHALDLDLGARAALVLSLAVIHGEGAEKLVGDNVRLGRERDERRA
mmetsp:Transcript_30977/g.90293  ORF Transcript_30977/g.90293 Transcript_30977/m.90293 type:complete len:543 (+) Transcript_30977:1328-2956(+)